MPDPGVAPAARGRTVRTLLVGVSAVALLVAVSVTAGPAAACALVGLLAVLSGFVALVAGRPAGSSGRGRRGAVAVLALGGAGAFLGGTAFGAPLPDDARPHPSSTRLLSTVPAAPAGGALATLATLPVKGPAPMTGYERERRFGRAWIDVDRNGCDTRNDVLRRDLTGRAEMRCRVLSGLLEDPYTGRSIEFERGRTTSEAVQIDHVVALADAWRTGAQQLPKSRRVQLANDPLNLFAVDGPTNMSKGDGDAATWLPKRKAFRCTYVAHQVAVKRAYALWVTPAEGAAMRRVLARCPDQPLPRPGLAADPTPTPTTPTASTTATPSAPVARRGGVCDSADATAADGTGRALACATGTAGGRLRWRLAS